MNRHETRACELMIGPDASRKYVGLCQTGRCPDCGYEAPDRYEATLVTHARLCRWEAPDSVDRAEQALRVE